VNNNQWHNRVLVWLSLLVNLLKCQRKSHLVLMRLMLLLAVQKKWEENVDK
jgi:hypothetical protein